MKVKISSSQTDIETDSLFFLVAHLAVVTVRLINVMSRVYRMHPLVYRSAKIHRCFPVKGKKQINSSLMHIVFLSYLLHPTQSSSASF